MDCVFVVLRSRGPAWDDSKPLEAQAGWPAHAAFMDALFNERFAALVGPMEGTRDALLVLRASSEAEIIQRLAADPWTATGLLVTKQINPWQLRLGSLEAGMHPQPLICVRDVEASSRWYQRLLGCESAHGGREYERLVRDGQLILQLHRWDVGHHHGPIGDPDLTRGNGVLLWFELAGFQAAAARAAELRADVVKPRHRNPPDGDGGPNHWELWLRDPDGYTVVLASPDGTADGNWRP